MIAAKTPPPIPGPIYAKVLSEKNIKAVKNR